MRRLFLLSTLLVSSSLYANYGKVDVGALYVHMDVLESGKTVHTMEMGGARVDATLQIVHGLVLKPMLLYATGGGDFTSGGLGLGYYIPICDQFAILPSAGGTYSDIRTHFSLPAFGLFRLHEKFESMSGYVSLEMSYKPIECIRVSTVLQYAWSRTRTTIDVLGSSKSSTKGWNYALTGDYYLTENWSLNVAGGYNLTLSQEKHGIRAAGVRAGVGYTY